MLVVVVVGHGRYQQLLWDKTLPRGTFFVPVASTLKQNLETTEQYRTVL